MPRSPASCHRGSVPFRLDSCLLVLDLDNPRLGRRRPLDGIEAHHLDVRLGPGAHCRQALPQLAALLTMDGHGLGSAQGRVVGWRLLALLAHAVSSFCRSRRIVRKSPRNAATARSSSPIFLVIKSTIKASWIADSAACRRFIARSRASSTLICTRFRFCSCAGCVLLGFGSRSSTIGFWLP